MKKKAGQSIAIFAVAFFLLGARANFFPSWNLSEPGYVALGILLAAATLWITEAVPLFVTSLLVLFLSLVWLIPVMRDHGLEVDESVFMGQFFSDIILLFLGGFVLSAGLHKQRLDEYLARWMIRRSGASVPRLILSVMAVTAFLSMWISNTAAAAMMLALVIPVAGRLAADDRYRIALILAVPFAANIGGLGTPIGSPPNAIAMQYMTQMGLAPGFGMWMVIGVPGVIVMLVLSWVVLTRMYRGQAQAIEIDQEPIRFPPWRASLLVIGTTGLTIVGWVTTGWHGYSSGTVALLPVLVFFSSGLLNTRDLRGLSWDVLLLMGGGLCLGQVISRSGFADWLIDLAPVDGVRGYGLMLAFGTLACLMSSVMSNTATANLIMPIVLGLNVEPLEPIFIGTAFACTLAMPLPISTPPNAMTFSTEQITTANLIQPGVILTISGLVLAFTTGYWWWDWAGLF